MYQGGSQHYLQSYARSDYSFERGFITQNTGGDYQALAYKDGILYGGLPLRHRLAVRGHHELPVPAGLLAGRPDQPDRRVRHDGQPRGRPRVPPDAGGHRRATGRGHCSSTATAACGPAETCSARVRPRPRTTAATRSSATATRRRRRPRPTAATTLNGNDVTLTWNASTDNATTPIHYEILKDDPTFGTIVMGSTFDRTFTDTNVVDPSRYFIRAVDDGGNRSATTAAMSVSPTAARGGHPPGPRRRVVVPADGQDLGAALHQSSRQHVVVADRCIAAGLGRQGRGNRDHRQPRDVVLREAPDHRESEPVQDDHDPAQARRRRRGLRQRRPRGARQHADRRDHGDHARERVHVGRGREHVVRVPDSRRRCSAPATTRSRPRCTRPTRRTPTASSTWSSSPGTARRPRRRRSRTRRSTASTSAAPSSAGPVDRQHRGHRLPRPPRRRPRRRSPRRPSFVDTGLSPTTAYTYSGDCVRHLRQRVIDRIRRGDHHCRQRARRNPARPGPTCSTAIDPGTAWRQRVVRRIVVGPRAEPARLG